MDIDRFTAAILLANFQLSHYNDKKKALEEIARADSLISDFLHQLSIKQVARKEPLLTLSVAEMSNKVTLTTNYAVLVQKTVPAGKTFYVSKVEMYCDNYGATLWEFIVNDKVVEMEGGTTWTDIELPVAFTMTFDGLLEVQATKAIKVRAKDDGSSAHAWADITGVIK